MARKELLDRLSIYMPKTKLEEKPVESLFALVEKRDRLANCLVVEAIPEYLEREEQQ